ncbi:MAG: hypothetical protein IPI58_04575 [Alphaproteobacteria bacterium]|nr:MAG: hypothetical protein IPI58_04575 [Alphaproteobacteria bacterium]
MAILAVLASAIAAASGSFNGDTSAVSAKAQAAAILEYADSVKIGVDRVVAKGCADTEISFENPIVSGYANSNAPSDKSCHVFDMNGGGIVWKNPDINALDPSWKSQADIDYPELFGTYVFKSGCGAHLGRGGGPAFGYDAAGWPCVYDGSGPERASQTADLFLILPWMKDAVYQELYKQTGMKGTNAQGNAELRINRFDGNYSDGMVRCDDPLNRGAVQGVINGASGGGSYWQGSYGGYYYFRALHIR